MYSRPRGGLHAQEYRLRLKQPAPTLSPRLGVPSIYILNPSRSSQLLPLQAFFRGALLTLRFRLKKYAPAYFFDRNRTSKKLRQLTKPRLSAAAHYNQLTKSTNMSTALNNHSIRSTVSGTVAISDDEMRRFAPSVFASQPIEGVSERYSFLPTSSILTGMRENGWVPVRAQEQCIRTSKRCFRSVDGERFVVI